MTTQLRCELVENSTPYHEHEVRAFMDAEAGKYKPNFWWKVLQWQRRHERLYWTSFLLVMVIAFFMYGEPFELGSILKPFLIAVILLCTPIYAADRYQRCPAKWRVLGLDSLQIPFVRHHSDLFFEIHSDAYYEVEALSRAPNLQALAQVVWYVIPGSHTEFRYGVLVWVK